MIAYSFIQPSICLVLYLLLERWRVSSGLRDRTLARQPSLYDISECFHSSRSTWKNQIDDQQLQLDVVLLHVLWTVSRSFSYLTQQYFNSEPAPSQTPQPPSLPLVRTLQLPWRSVYDVNYQDDVIRYVSLLETKNSLTVMSLLFLFVPGYEL